MAKSWNCMGKQHCVQSQFLALALKKYASRYQSCSELSAFAWILFYRELQTKTFQTLFSWYSKTEQVSYSVLVGTVFSEVCLIKTWIRYRRSILTFSDIFWNQRNLSHVFHFTDRLPYDLVSCVVYKFQCGSAMFPIMLKLKNTWK